MGRRILAIGAAVLLALVGAALVLVYAMRADERALAELQPERVYVVTETVPSGTSLKEALRLELIEPTQVARSGVPGGALQEVGPPNQELLALIDIPVGTYVLEGSFGEQPLSQKAIDVPDGHLAISLELSDPARVGTFVTPGSHLAIFATYPLKESGIDEEDQASNDGDVRGTSILLDDVLVLGMGQRSLSPAESTESGEQDSNAGGFLVTLAVTPEQATRLVHAIQQYALYAGLRSDNLEITPPDLTITDLTIVGVDAQ